MGEILGIGATHYPPGLVPEEHQPMLGPLDRYRRFRGISHYRDTITTLTFPQRLPAITRKHAVITCGSDRASARKFQVVHRFHTSRPYDLRACRYEFLLLIQRPHFRLLPDQ